MQKVYFKMETISSLKLISSNMYFTKINLTDIVL